MTMRTCGRVVPFGIDVVPLGVAETLAGRIMFIAALTPKYPLEIAGDAQPLESIFSFVVQRPARALRHLGAVEFGEDFIDAGGGRSHRIGDVLIAQRTIALAILREIKRDDRNVLALGVGPDVGLGP